MSSCKSSTEICATKANGDNSNNETNECSNGNQNNSYSTLNNSNAYIDTLNSNSISSHERIEWSRSRILGFIEDYRRERVLWDPNTKGYHIKQIKYEALKALGDKYNTEIRSIRSKIKSLRSSFHREHGKVINSRLKGLHYQPMWFAYEAIRFILEGDNEDDDTTSTIVKAESTTETNAISSANIKMAENEPLALTSQKNSKKENTNALFSEVNSNVNPNKNAAQGLTANEDAAFTNADNNSAKLNKSFDSTEEEADEEDSETVTSGVETDEREHGMKVAAAAAALVNNYLTYSNAICNGAGRHVDIGFINSHNSNNKSKNMEDMNNNNNIFKYEKICLTPLTQTSAYVHVPNNVAAAPACAASTASLAFHPIVDNTASATTADNTNMVARVAAAFNVAAAAVNAAAAAAVASNNTEHQEEQPISNKRLQQRSGTDELVALSSLEANAMSYSPIDPENLKTEIVEDDGLNISNLEIQTVDAAATFSSKKTMNSAIKSRKRKMPNLSGTDEGLPYSTKMQTRPLALLCEPEGPDDLSFSSPISVASVSTGTNASTSNNIATLPESSSSQANDEYRVFGEYVSLTIRKLKTVRSKVVVKHLINNLLYEAELGKYDQGIPSTNEPPQLYRI